ncbi:hypothetical protein [Streptomyces flavidovirens]|uniref:Uncharacterized protein n=1 Tax=Streptomyces flavidovirens TaxID=67298 RepID=A0ABW6RSU1_9ACTN
MPGDSDKPMSDGSEDEGAPRARGESRSTVRDVVVAGVAQAVLAELADEAARWFVQFVVWLYEMLVSLL